MRVPKCTNEKQYRYWLGDRERASLNSFCYDCTPQYKALMTIFGKCERSTGKKEAK